eukprot:11375927-Prorocentrum_lima.AAC.1
MRGDKTCTLVYDGRLYEIALQENAMSQRNCGTGKRRKIRYILALPKHWSTYDAICQLKRLNANVGLEGGLN